MRTLLVGTFFGLALVGSASAADLRYGWDRPEPPPPAYQDEDGDERPRWREPEWRRPLPPQARLEDQNDDEEDEPQCWVRRTPYGPERVCR